VPPPSDTAQDPSHWTLAARRRPRSRWRQLGGGLAFLAFGGVFLWFMVPEIAANLEAARWTPSRCRILSSGVATQVSEYSGEPPERTLYKVDVSYTYDTPEGPRQSTRYRFIDPYSDNRTAAESAAARYAPGTVAPCYVDPDDPAQAVLDRRLSPFMLVALVPGAIAALGLVELATLGADIARTGRVR
jgi:hypothetical protein